MLEQFDFKSSKTSCPKDICVLSFTESSDWMVYRKATFTEIVELYCVDPFLSNMLLICKFLRKVGFGAVPTQLFFSAEAKVGRQLSA